MIKHGFKNKLISLLLIGTISTSLTGCGNKETEDITDYGTLPEATESVVSLPVENLSEVSRNTTSMSLQEIYGDPINFQLDLKSSGTDIKANISKPLPEGVDHLNVYDLKNSRDWWADEESYADGFFDGEAKKVVSFDIESETKYISLMHKYRDIVNIMENNPHDVFLIKPDTDMQFAWVDNENYSIHLYEGSYNGTAYGLILAHNVNDGMSYISFNPLDIDEYFPDGNYSTLMLEEAQTPYTEPIENKCPLDEDALFSTAKDFLSERVGLSDVENQLTLDYEPYANIFDNYYYLKGYLVKYHDTITALSFSDSDYVSTMHYYNTAYRGIEILRDQPDQFAEFLQTHDIKYISDGFGKVTSYSDTDLGTNITTDGYAVYLKSQFTVDEPNDDNIFVTKKYENTGIIKITSKGIYGVDLMLTGQIENVTERVDLLDIDNLKESLVSYLDNYPSRIEHMSGATITDMLIDYTKMEDANDPNHIIMVPIWRFVVSSIYQDGSIIYSSDILINAMDGSILEEEEELLPGYQSLYDEALQGIEGAGE